MSEIVKVDARTRGRWRLVKRLYVAGVVAYAILGIVLGVSASAQPRSSIVPAPGESFLTPPSGSSDAVVSRYYEYLSLQELATFRQTYPFNAVPLLEMYGVGAVLLIVTYFFIFAWFARLRSGDLYPVEVYNGYITERGGPIDPFNWAVYAVLILYAGFYIFVSLRFGQIY